VSDTKTAPIIISISRKGQPSSTITVTPIEPVDRVWGRYNVEFDYPGVDGRRKEKRCLENFPRALGVDKLALFLLDYVQHTTNWVYKDDSSFPDQGWPRLPSPEERDARPITIGPIIKGPHT